VRRLPLKPFAVYNLLKEIRTAVEDFRPLVLAGAAEPAAKIAAPTIPFCFEKLVTISSQTALRILGSFAASA